jgi:hypothetical protein
MCPKRGETPPESQMTLGVRQLIMSCEGSRLYALLTQGRQTPVPSSWKNTCKNRIPDLLLYSSVRLLVLCGRGTSIRL